VTTDELIRRPFILKVVLDMGDYDETTWEELATLAEVDARNKALLKMGARVPIYQEV
jgi:hypothetical protein